MLLHLYESDEFFLEQIARLLDLGYFELKLLRVVLLFIDLPFELHHQHS